MVLVTTALEETFPKDKNKKILFLGEWCKLYSKKDIYEQYDYETLAYHWDDREKLYEDTKSIDVIYEKYLEMLKNNLNKIHNVEFSISYWRIILGPWLRYFIEMTYDRYLSVLEVSKMDIDYVNIIDFKDEDIVPNDMGEFAKLYTTDVWNQFIYQNITSFFDIKVKNRNILLNDKRFKKNQKISLKHRIANILFFINKFNKIHFFSSYIKFKNLSLLQLTLGQIPTTGTTLNIALDIDYSFKLRDKLIFSNTESLFEEILVKLIKKQIPKYYLEGYSEFRDKVLNKYPQKAKIIFTANAYSSDDVFKFWTAEKKEKGAKYIIGQHGGNFGMGRFSSHENHQIESSNKFFSWGWNLPNTDKVIPVSAIKLNIKINSNTTGDILIPLSSFPRYSYHLMAMPIAGQTLDIITDQVNYLKLVSNDLKKILKLRIYPNDYGWNFKQRFIDFGFESSLESEENLAKSFHKRLGECRLCIATYNATTYLETFSANFPTLLYWNPKHWELRDEVKPYFEMLENVGILHYTEESLVLKLSEIYLNPLDWWLGDEVQYSKNKFCYRFANMDYNYVYNYKKEISQLIGSIPN